MMEKGGVIKLVKANDLSNLKIYGYANILSYVKDRYFLCSDNECNNFLVITSQTKLDKLAIEFSGIIFLLNEKDFFEVLEKNLGYLSTMKAKYFLTFNCKLLGAKNINYIKNIFIFIAFFIVIFEKNINFFCLMTSCSYFVESCFKTTLFYTASYKKSDLKESLSLEVPTKVKSNGLGSGSIEADLINNKRASEAENAKLKSFGNNMPIYTILIPLYKEVGNIASIIKAMILIDYPIEKLDIKIIIEADDLNMFKELMLLEIPKYFHIIKVPYSIPRTKPKALNYAMDYSFGEYVTIYDAEDRPEPSQLRKVLEQFNMLTSEYACIQAKLCFYNEDQNLLTKLFSIEYCLWFEYILQGLSALNLPVTLGGTSNHFKTEYLIKLGYWDAYNVTEDAELGIRIYSSGYKTHVIDSYTFEESPISIGNWIDQRSRWIKGFFQTFLIVLFRNNADIQLKWPQKITLYILLGFSSFGFCAMPWMLFAISKMEINYIILNISSANIFLSLLYIYFAAFFILKKKKGMVRNFKLLDICALIIWPCYFILHSIAAYKALWELAFKPFAWNKTQHGLND